MTRVQYIFPIFPTRATTHAYSREKDKDLGWRCREGGVGCIVMWIWHACDLDLAVEPMGGGDWG